VHVRFVVCLLCSAMLLGGCFVTAKGLDAKHGQADPAASEFPFCRHYGCADVIPVSLNALEWQSVIALFQPTPASAAQERERVAVAIGLLERLVGAKTGTQNDPPGSKMYTPDSKGELDCLDEAVNTTTYLRLLSGEGLLRFHDLGEPAYRGFFIDGAGPHNTATLIEHETRARFAIDSFFHGNGNTAEVVPLDVWRRHWHPKHKLPPRLE
jgi:hypothetical protein